MILNLKQLERLAIIDAMVQSHGRVELAAQLLGIRRTNVYQRLKRHKLTVEQFQQQMPNANTA